MATSGSTDYSVDAKTLVTEALRAVGLRVTDDAESYTTAATIIASAARRLGIHYNPSAGDTAAATIIDAAYKRIGIYKADSTETYSPGSAIVERALRMLGISDPTDMQISDAYRALEDLDDEWVRYGMTKSGSEYPDQWRQAFVMNVAMNLAFEYGLPIRPELRELAAVSLVEARRTPLADLSTSATNILSELATSWRQYGLEPGSDYADEWVGALTDNLALRLAWELGKEPPPGLAEYAIRCLEEAKKQPTDAKITTAGTQILTDLEATWAQYGMTLSGADYPNRWVQALTDQTAVYLAYELGKLPPDGLIELAQKSFIEARAFTKIDDGLTALNIMLKTWQGKGIHSWARKSTNFSLTADKVSYTIYNGGDVSVDLPARVLDAYVRNADGIDVPLIRLPKERYDDLSDKDASGVPTQFWFDKQTTTSTLYLWPVIDESGYSVTIDYHRPIEDLDATTDDLDLPQEYYEAAKYNLAVRLAAQNDRPVPREVAALAMRTMEEAEMASREGVMLEVQPAVGDYW